ncbi:ester cyclase [Kineococcus terrestris]|uniref:ester cyclase n=1 Tax=Kineococcus terrestris TaxID=2044856 RepID=UPI0034DB35B1
MATQVHPNIELLQRSLALLTSGRVDQLADLLTDDFRINVHGAPTRVGRDAWRENVAIMQASFSDLSVEVLHALADGDLVAVNLRFTARHTGDFLGVPATGRTVRYDSLEHYRVRDGLIAEEWIASDVGTLLSQLGVER